MCGKDLNMIKTFVFTKIAVSKLSSRAKLVFKGETLLQIRKGDEIQVIKNFPLERVSSVSYSLVDNSQEIILDTIGKEYPSLNLECT